MQAVGCIAQQAVSANGAAAADGAAKAGRQLYVGAQARGYRRDNMEVRGSLFSSAAARGLAQDASACACMCAQVMQALKDGLYDDWDAVEGIWDHIFRRARLPLLALLGRAASQQQNCQQSSM